MQQSSHFSGGISMYNYKALNRMHPSLCQDQQSCKICCHLFSSIFARWRLHIAYDPFTV